MTMQFYKNILLSGGTSMFPGLSSRLEKDIREQYCQTILKGGSNHISKSINVIVGEMSWFEGQAQPNRKHAVFTGAAVFAKYIANRPDQWISRNEWEECGVRVLEKM